MLLCDLLTISLCFNTRAYLATGSQKNRLEKYILDGSHFGVILLSCSEMYIPEELPAGVRTIRKDSGSLFVPSWT